MMPSAIPVTMAPPMLPAPPMTTTMRTRIRMDTPIEGETET